MTFALPFQQFVYCGPAVSSLLLQRVLVTRCMLEKFCGVANRQCPTATLSRLIFVVHNQWVASHGATGRHLRRRPALVSCGTIHLVMLRAVSRIVRVILCQSHRRDNSQEKFEDELTIVVVLMHMQSARALLFRDYSTTTMGTTNTTTLSTTGGKPLLPSLRLSADSAAGCHVGIPHGGVFDAEVAKRA